MTLYKIYKIIDTFTGEVLYVGSTKQELQKRLTQHKNDITYPEKSQYLNSRQVDIELICEAMEESHLIREQTYFKKLNPMFGRHNAKSNKTDQTKEMEKAIAIAKAIIKRNKGK